MKKKSLNLSKKLFLNKETITSLDKILGGGPTTVGCPPGSANCPPASINCPSFAGGNCDTISICNDQCAVTWGCPPDNTQVINPSVCVICYATLPTQPGC